MNENEIVRAAYSKCVKAMSLIPSPVLVVDDRKQRIDLHT